MKRPAPPTASDSSVNNWCVVSAQLSTTVACVRSKVILRAGLQVFTDHNACLYARVSLQALRRKQVLPQHAAAAGAAALLLLFTPLTAEAKDPDAKRTYGQVLSELVR